LSLAHLGASGLKISKVMLGMMNYGSPEWQKWVLEDKEGIEHVKAASVVVSLPLALLM
ncbi:hypothetical protein K439DRAFT_1362825, partial [Ramaria rubella]